MPLSKLNKDERLFYSLNPFLVAEQCFEFIEKQGGLLMEGIYRINGNEKEVKQLIKCLVKKKPLPKDGDVYSVASLLKRHLQSCDTPIIPHKIYNQILEHCGSPTQLKEILKQNLAFEQFRTLRFILQHLCSIIKQSMHNKMNPKNIAIIFGATLIKSGNPEENPIEYLHQIPKLTKAFQNLIEEYNYIFEEGDLSPNGEEEKQLILQQENAQPTNFDVRASTEYRSSPLQKSCTPEWTQKRRAMTISTLKQLFTSSSK